MIRRFLIGFALVSVASSGALAPLPALTLPAVYAAGQAVPAATRPALPLENDSVRFAVIGDTGTGDAAQYQTGARLVEARATFPFEFVIMMGDNLYGSQGPAALVSKFEKPYQKLLDSGVKFFASLGNHDAVSQTLYKPFNMGGKRFYSFRQGDVEFFVLDSSYMTPAQIDWLKGALQKSDAKWKIPYMHHPLYSSGEKHGSQLDLRILIEPFFLEHGVDVVFAGHEHFYERLKPQKGITYFTEGGSAKLREGNIHVGSAMTAKGFDTDNSFMIVEIAKDQLFFQTISRTGALVDSGSVFRRGGTPIISK